MAISPIRYVTYFYLNSALLTGNTNYGVGIYSVSSIWTSDAFYSSSDSRIKENIQDLDDPQCLSMINAIQPKTYQYVDKLSRGNHTVYGFIAQQVGEVLPPAVSTQKEIIPSVYCISDLCNNTLTIHDPSGTKDLTQLLEVGDKVKIYDIYNKDYYITVVSVDSSCSFTFSSSEPLNDAQYFVYGKEVSDFHTLNKDYIFTVNVCATQELSRKVDELQQENNALETKVAQLEAENVAKQQQIERLYAHLGLTM